MHLDYNTNENNEYQIRSIYFDDYQKTAVKQKELGLKDRYKYRIRFYNSDTQVIKLEKKVKNSNVGYKNVIPLTYEEANKLLNSDFEFLSLKNNPIANELLLLRRNKLIQPIIIIDYFREPYVLPFNDIRITFDKKISYSTDLDEAFNSNLILNRTIENVVMEVKYNGFLPKYLKNLISVDNINKMSISKFLLCYLHSIGEEILI
jgi:hypothetical protein